MELTGLRLRFREVERSDLPDLVALLGDPKQVRYIEFEATESSAQCLLDWSIRTAQEKPRTAYSFAITLWESNRCIGLFSLVIRNPAERVGHLGIILNRRFQGKGFAAEAGNCMLAFGFDTLSLQKLCAGCHAENRVSARAIEKLGFRRDTDFVRPHWQKGVWNDWLHYELFDSEWRGRQ